MSKLRKSISRVEKIWNEAGMFARDLISDKWIDLNWGDVPKHVQEQFTMLVSEDIPREAFFR